MRAAFVAFLLMLSLAWPAAGQSNSGKTPPKNAEPKQAEQSERSKGVLRELTQGEYRAKKDIPAADCIFVEDGKLFDATYRSALKEHPLALRAGEVTKVSSVRVMDRGIQVFFAGDSCAVIGVSARTEDTAAMSAKELVEMAQKAIAPLFGTVSEGKGAKEEKAETKEEVKKKS